MTGRDEFVERAEGARPAVVYAAVELDASVDPLAAYAALGGGQYDFLLESAEKVAGSDPNGAFDGAETARDGRARYSFVGYDPEAVVTVDGEPSIRTLGDGRYAERVDFEDGDVLDRLREALPDVPRRGFPAGTPFEGGLVGFLAYDAVYDIWLDEQGVERPDSRFPDAEFVLTAKTLVFDHVAGTVSLAFTPLVLPDEDVGAVYDELVAEADRVADALDSAGDPEFDGYLPADGTAGPRSAYEGAVRRAKEHVAAGDVYQGVVSRTRELRGEIDPLGLYAALREVNPSPYMYLLGHDDLTVVGASPETLVSVRDDEVTANPIAGTCPRGTSPMEDRRLAGELLADGKERAEHAMLVDLARNDVRRVAESGSVGVDEFMTVVKYSHVQHIESTVTGTLSEGSDAFDAVRATFPAGTLTGAPKVRAMEVIDDLEDEPRGVYGGGVGYVSWTGDADFAIVIRTATVETLEGGLRTGERGTEHPASRETRASPNGRGTPSRITVRAGAGIVADSDPAAEYEETEQKMGGVLAALERIERPGEPVGTSR